MMVPRAFSPSTLTKPPDALFESVTSCARASRAGSPSTRRPRVPEPTTITACSGVCGRRASWAEVRLAAVVFAEKYQPVWRLQARRLDPDQRVGAKGVIDMQHPMLVMPIEPNRLTAFSASR